MADDRDSIADERDRIAEERERTADRREVDLPVGAATITDVSFNGDDVGLIVGDLRANAYRRQRQRDRASRTNGQSDPGLVEPAGWETEKLEFLADDREEQADERETLADEREALSDRRDAHRVDHGDVNAELAERALAATARRGAETARRTASHDRQESGGPHPLAAEFVAMGKSLLQADTIELAMADVVQAAVQFVHGCDSASFSALVGDIVTTLASTGLVADELDQAQYTAAEGPCLQAIKTLELVICDDLWRDDRWPAFVAAAGSSARSAMATPVADDLRPGSPFGAVNSYALRANAFDGEDVDTAMLLTAHLGVLLCLARTTRESTDHAVQLAEAINTRDVIGQAKGILMERHRLTAAQAFDLLRTASQRLNRKLRDVADDLAASGEIAEPRR